MVGRGVVVRQPPCPPHFFPLEPSCPPTPAPHSLCLSPLLSTISASFPYNTLPTIFSSSLPTTYSQMLLRLCSLLRNRAQHMEVQPLLGQAAVMALLIGQAGDGVCLNLVPGRISSPSQSQALPNSKQGWRGEGRQKLQSASRGWGRRLVWV